MSRLFITTCPHCGEQIKIPYAEVEHFVLRQQGLRSVAKRKDLKEHVSNMSRKRWAGPLHPKQQKILELAQSEGLAGLTLNEIAEKVGITSPWREHYAWRHLNQLRKKGLLSEK